MWKCKVKMSSAKYRLKCNMNPITKRERESDLIKLVILNAERLVKNVDQDTSIKIW